MILKKTLSSPLRLFLIFTLWALVLTYPLVLRPFSHIPLGSEAVGTVPFFNLWTLQWNIDQLMQGYPRYWDAPIFAPARGAFAFSEPQPLSALLAAPLWLGLQSPAFAYNALIILFLTLNGWFTYWLLKSWDLPPLPSLLAGLLTQTLPFIAQELGVLQLVAIFGLLWSLLYLNRFLTGHLSPPSSRHLWPTGLCLALGTPVTFLTCGYYGLFSFIFLPLALLFYLHRKHLQPKMFVQLLAVGLIAFILTGPFIWAQRQRLLMYGFSRSAQTVETNSAKLSYYHNFLDHNLLYGRLLGRKSEPGQRLFPGFGLLLLAGLGLLGRAQPRIKLYLILAAILALGLSMGLRLNLAGFLPYQWIKDHLPGFSQLRSPFRFAALVQLHLALLAGFGLQNLGHWWQPRFPWGPVLVTSLALFETLALPLPLQRLPMLTFAPWQVWLNGQDPTPTIVLLPFAQSNRVADFEQTTRWMLASHHFQGNMLNGYSGFFPANHNHLREQMLQFPTAESIELLRQQGSDYVVVDHRLAKAPQAEAIKKYLPLVYWDQLTGMAIYRLN